jgi:hypothetical protein
MCRFTATGLTCEGKKKRAKNGYPNCGDGRMFQQNVLEEGRAAAKIASKQKHSPVRKQFNASSIVSSVLISGRAR